MYTNILSKDKNRGQTLISLFAIILIIAIVLALLAVILFSSAQDAQQRSLRQAETKKLSRIYLFLQMYVYNNFDKNGGGHYPRGAKSPHEAYQSLVNGGFIKDPNQIKFPGNTDHVAPVKKGKLKKGQPRFDLTAHDKYVDFSWTSIDTTNEDEDPRFPLASSRWINEGHEKPRTGHIDGRNVLLTTGRVLFCKRNSIQLQNYEKKLLFNGPKKTNPKETKKGKSSSLQYTDPKYGFSFTTLPRWKKVDLAGGQIHLFLRGPRVGKFSAKLLVTTHLSQDSLKKELDNFLKKEAEMRVQLKKKSSLTIAGNSAYRWQTQRGTIRSCKWVFIRDKRVFVFGLFSHQKTYSDHLKQWEKALQTLQFNSSSKGQRK